MSGKNASRKTAGRHSTRVSLASLPPDEAVADLLKVKPERATPTKKRAAKGARKRS